MQQIESNRRKKRRKNASDQEGVDHLSNLPPELLKLVTAHLDLKERVALRGTSTQLQGDVTGEEAYWTDPALVDNLYHTYQLDEYTTDEDAQKNDLRVIINDARRWAKVHPDVEVVVAFGDAKGDGQCYVCDVGGTMGGIVMGLRAHWDALTHDQNIFSMALSAFLQGQHPPRLRRRLGSNVTVRTQLCIIPMTTRRESLKGVRDVIGEIALIPRDGICDYYIRL